MKKIFTLMMAAALGVTAMTAQEAMEFSPATMQVPMSWDTQYRAIPNLTERPQSRAARKAAAAKSFRPKARVDAEVPVSPEGYYVNIFISPFVNYLDQEMTEAVTVAPTDNEGEYTFQGLGGWELTGWSEAVTPLQLITGTYADGVISIPMGQKLATYTSGGVTYDLMLVCPAEEEGKWAATAQTTVKLEYIDGSFEANEEMRIAEIADNSIAGWFGGTGYALMVPANGHISYTYENGQNGYIKVVDNPVYYEFMENADGSETLMMSSLLPFDNGYLFDAYLYNQKDGHETFMADTTSVVFTKAEQNDDGVWEFDYYSMAGASTSYPGRNLVDGSKCPLNTSNRDSILIPDDAFAWSIDGERWPVECWAISYLWWNEEEQANYITYIGFMGASVLEAYKEGENPALRDYDGINTINVDNSTVGAPVYYNLQGVQISKPAAGQIYIERTGSAARKVIF